MSLHASGLWRLGYGGFSLHPVLDAWARENGSFAFHTMFCERAVYGVELAYGMHGTGFTTDRLWSIMSQSSQQPPPIDITHETYKRLTKRYNADAEARREATLLGGGDGSGHQRKHIKMLLDLQIAREAAAANPQVRQRRNAAATTAIRAADARPQEFIERCRLVKSLRFMPIQAELLASLDPSLTLEVISRFNKGQLLAKLMEPSCGTMDMLKGAVGLLSQQAKDMGVEKAEKKAQKQKRKAAGDGEEAPTVKRPRRAAAAPSELAVSPSEVDEDDRGSQSEGTGAADRSDSDYEPS